MEITVYTKPSCVQCTATYRALDSRGIAYEVIDVTQDNEALEKIKTLGYLQAPVVVIDDRLLWLDGSSDNLLPHWSGFRPDQIALLATRMHELQAASTAAAAN